MSASRLVVAEHYLHRRPPISHAFGIHVRGKLLGAVTYGTPASRHLQMGACPSGPSFDWNEMPPPAPSRAEEVTA